MDDERADKSRYFQDVSRAFLQLRGAPFILSARELHVLASWQKEGIPLEAVRDGLERAFHRRGERAAPGRGRISLAYCDAFVRRAYDQVRDRKIGGRRPARTTSGRKERIRVEVATFLKEFPVELAFVEDVFRQVLRLLEKNGENDGELERLEKKIEKALADHGTDEERDRAARQLRREAPADGGEPGRDRIRARLVKNLRERYGIPFVSFPYY